MAYGRYIVIKGPDRQGDFVATMPDGESRLVMDWEDVEVLRQEADVHEVYGDVLELKDHLSPNGVHPDFTTA